MLLIEFGEKQFLCYHHCLANSCLLDHLVFISIVCSCSFWLRREKNCHKFLFESLTLLEVTLLFKGINDKEAVMHEPEMLYAVVNINIEFYYNMITAENATCRDFASIYYCFIVLIKL